MKNTLTARFVLPLLFLGLAVAPCSAIVVTLGDQDFNDGDTVFLIPFEAANAGDPAPFNDFMGSDPAASDNFSATFTFTGYGTGTVTAASLTIGILDHDSMAAGSQILAFGVDGNDLTADLDALFEASGGANNEYNIYNLTLGAGVFGALGDGTATFALDLMGPGLSLLAAPSNGAGLDFATLDVTFSPAVPEPSTWLLLSSGLVGLLWRARRKR